MSKYNVLWDSVETIHPRDGSTTPLDPTILKQTDRLLLRKVRTRRLLGQFCNNSPPLTQKDFTLLMKSLRKECKPIALLIANLQEEEKRRSSPHPLFNFSFPGIWKEFLALFSTNTSAAWIFRPDFVPTLLHLIDIKIYSPDIHQQVAIYCPQLGTALVHIPNGQVPQEMLDLL